jgi:hypothetical protein
LSADLEERLASGSQAIDVIVHGTRAEVDALASRYNLRVKRYLRSGAVFRVTGGVAPSPVAPGYRVRR